MVGVFGLVFVQRGPSGLGVDAAAQLVVIPGNRLQRRIRRLTCGGPAKNVQSHVGIALDPMPGGGNFLRRQQIVHALREYFRGDGGPLGLAELDAVASHLDLLGRIARDLLGCTGKRQVLGFLRRYAALHHEDGGCRQRDDGTKAEPPRGPLSPGSPWKPQ